MNKNLLFSVNEKGVASITLNRPEIHNAFDDALIQELLKTLKNIEQDSSIKIVLLKAEGKNFSAGADLNWMRRMAAYSYDENVKDALALSDLMHTLKFLNKPTIARVQGAAFGGGVGLIACCDIVIASTQASFCLSEVKIGLIPAVISPYVLSAIGERAARRYFLTAETFTAREAQHFGLVSEITEIDQLDIKIQQITDHILQNSPQAVIKAKELINRVTTTPYNKEQLQKNAEAIAAIRVSEEGQAGLNKFLNKSR